MHVGELSTCFTGASSSSHLHILFWKHAEVFPRFTLSSRVFHRKLPLKDIESSSKYEFIRCGKHTLLITALFEFLYQN